MISENYYTSNEAITTSGDDRFNFLPYSEKIKEAVRKTATSNEPLVFGIYAGWGEGKTSFVNLIFKNLESNQTEALPGIIKYTFNAWRYNSEDQLLSAFFGGLIKVLSHDYSEESKDVVNLLKEYIKTVISGSTLEFIAGIDLGVKATMKVKTPIDPKGSNGIKNLESQKKEVDNKLKEFNYRIVVFIDDIDRLTKKEISNVFRLIKLTASFKNVTFIVAFDEEIVAKAIYPIYGEFISDGYSYLEKIINIPIRLPVVEKYLILKELKLQLKNVFIKNEIKISNEIDILNFSDPYVIGNFRFEEDIWQIEKVIDNPRELVRLVNTFSTNIIALKGAVNYSDLLWFDLLKIKYNSIYNFIKENPDYFVLRKLNKDRDKDSENKLKEFIGQQDFKESEGNQIINIVKKLFPFETMMKGLNKKETVIVKFDSDKSFLERRINNHKIFNIFFNYHTKDIISTLEISNFLELVEGSDIVFLTKKLKELIGIFGRELINYELENRIELINSNTSKYKFIQVILQSINLLTSDKDGLDISSMTSRDKMISRIFELCASLDSHSISKIITSNINDFSLSDLLCVRRGLVKQEVKIELREYIDDLVIDKVRTNYNDSPFFLELEAHISLSIYSVWKISNNQKFNEYIDKHLSVENVVNFLLSFATVWISTGKGVKEIGNIERVNYMLIKNIIDPSKIANLLYEKYPILTDKTSGGSSLSLEEIKRKKLFSNINHIDKIIQFNRLYIDDVVDHG